MLSVLLLGAFSGADVRFVLKARVLEFELELCCVAFGSSSSLSLDCLIWKMGVTPTLQGHICEPVKLSTGHRSVL